MKATLQKNMIINQTLKISIGNKKLDKATQIFDLPAGHSCPGALKCLAFANRETGKITDGENIDFRCYAASQEAIFSRVRSKRWSNFELIKKSLKGKNGIKNCADLIERSLYLYLPKCRIHSSGDFFNEKYFLAWVEVARRQPQIKFYAYTKALNFWTKNKKIIPKNLILTASYGGKYDNLIKENKLKHSIVFFDSETASQAKKMIDKDDSLAINPTKKSFGLLLHGVQPAGMHNVHRGQLQSK